MNNGTFDEAELEQAIIELFKGEGYEYLNGNDIDRTYEEILLLDDLRGFIASRYFDESLTATELEKRLCQRFCVNSKLHKHANFC